ncbi:MAG: ComF family protein [Hydrogenophaga sp.]
MAIDTGQCGSCADRVLPASFDRCVVAVDYVYPWDGLVARFKFRQQPGWAGPLAQLMLRSPDVARLLRHADAVVPVPLTQRRLADRGYNQAWELVKALRRAALRRRLRSPPGLPQGLLRMAETPDQHSLPRSARLHNLSGVLSANPVHRAVLAGRHVLVVDDVTTSGATLEAAAHALKQAGARTVSALAFARTPHA